MTRRIVWHRGRQVRRAKAAGTTTSLDMSLPDPQSPAGRAKWARILTGVLPHVDVFLPSWDEILFMLDRPRFERTRAGGDPDATLEAELLNNVAERLISLGAAIVVIKLGDKGLFVRTTGRRARLEEAGRGAPAKLSAWAARQLYAPCFEVKVAGTTGSGDCTVAGFLAAMLKGLSPEQALTAAAAMGAFNVEAPDATSGIPRWEVMERRVAGGWPRRPPHGAFADWTEARGGVRKGPQDGTGS